MKADREVRQGLAILFLVLVVGLCFGCFFGVFAIRLFEALG